MRRAAAVIAAALWGCSCGLGPTGAWRVGTTPPVLITGSGATVALPGDRLGVFGDVVSSTGQPIARTLIYDSVQNRWSQGAPIPEPRYAESVVALTDGEVLFAGGYGTFNPNTFPPEPPMLTSTYVYDPAKDSWRRAGDLAVARVSAQAITLSDGRVLVTGGTSEASAEVFDPTSGAWSRAGSMRETRYGEILAPLPGGRAMAAGGCMGTALGFEPGALASAEVFDPGTRNWREVRAMPEPRCGASGVPLPDGRVLVIGGWAAPRNSLHDTLIFDPSSETWSPAGQIVAAGALFGDQPIPYGLLSDRRVFVPVAQMGRRNGPFATVAVGGQIFDSASGSWSYATTTAATTSARFGAPQVIAVVALRSDRVLILLENDTLIFDAAASPPQSALLDSSSLTTPLLVITLALIVAIGVIYLGGRLRRSTR